MKNDRMPVCSNCDVKERVCEVESGHGPDFCPTLYQEEAVKKAVEECEKPDIREFARQGSILEGECYANRGSIPMFCIR